MIHATVSVDVGVKNLAIVIVTESSAYDFQLFDLTKPRTKLSVAVDRCTKIKNILRNIAEQYIIDRIIIERQVKTNVIACNIMYSIISFALSFVPSSDIIMFDPKTKFTLLGISYSTRSKQHKRLSINLVSNFLRNTDQEAFNSFTSFKKQDDLADALLQALVCIMPVSELKEKTVGFDHLTTSVKNMNVQRVCKIADPFMKEYYALPELGEQKN